MNNYAKHPLFWIATIPMAALITPVVAWLNATERYAAVVIAMAVQIILLVVQIVALALWTRHLRRNKKN